MVEKHQKKSMSMHSKLAFEKSLARNMLSRSNMDHCLADETSEGLWVFIKKLKFKFKDSLARNMLSRSHMDQCLADETSEGVYEYV
jgi:hypothetical protein